MEQLWTILIAATPIFELRGAIPIALTVYDLGVVETYILAVIGNLLPIIIILKYLVPVSKWLSENFKLFKKFFDWLFARTRRKSSKSYKRFGALALIIFVAIPLPITGAWTGAAAAFVFGIPYLKSLSLITIGVLISGLIVTLSTIGVITLF
ncbi:MAG: small multi-drug export protein [bacterium]